jgi:hypothetical protein
MQISAGNPITDYESPALTAELRALVICRRFLSSVADTLRVQSQG